MVQIIKRLDEMVKFNIFQVGLHVKDDYSFKKPNNGYILKNSKCCEIMEITDKIDEHDNKKLLCRVYEQVTPMFMHPCNSDLIGVYEAHERYSRIKILSRKVLDRRAVLVQEPGRQQVHISCNSPRVLRRVCCRL